MTPRHLYAFGALGAALLCVGLGWCGSYYFYNLRFANAAITNLYLSRELTDAKMRFNLMRAIASGRTDNAYLMSEGGVIGAVISMHAFPGATDEARAASREFLSAVTDFYKQHADRRAALGALLTKSPEVLEWIDSGK